MMDKTPIMSIGNNNIYFVKDDKVSFYVSIPMNVANNTLSMVINIISNMSGIDSNVSDINVIKNELGNVYVNYTDNNIAVITPIIDSNILEQLKLNNNDQIFTYTDKLISYLINGGYKFLSSGGIIVNKIVKLNDNKSFSSFNNWFVSKYGGRVELYNSVKSSGNEVISTSNDTLVDSEAQKIASNVLDNTNSFSPVVSNDESVPNLDVHEPGFVSYVLLGVVVVVISLVMLYMLL